jgi:hypothetical protein
MGESVLCVEKEEVDLAAFMYWRRCCCLGAVPKCECKRSGCKARHTNFRARVLPQDDMIVLDLFGE